MREVPDECNIAAVTLKLSRGRVWSKYLVTAFDSGASWIRREAKKLAVVLRCYSVTACIVTVRVVLITKMNMCGHLCKRFSMSNV